MADKTEHTPWEIVSEHKGMLTGTYLFTSVKDTNGRIIKSLAEAIDPEEFALWSLIVTAVNSHKDHENDIKEYREALEHLVDVFTSSQDAHTDREEPSIVRGRDLLTKHQTPEKS